MAETFLIGQRIPQRIRGDNQQIDFDLVVDEVDGHEATGHVENPVVTAYLTRADLDRLEELCQKARLVGLSWEEAQERAPLQDRADRTTLWRGMPPSGPCRWCGK